MEIKQYFLLKSSYFLIESIFLSILRPWKKPWPNKGGIEKKNKRSPLFLFKKTLPKQWGEWVSI